MEAKSTLAESVEEIKKLEVPEKSTGKFPSPQFLRRKRDSKGPASTNLTKGETTADLKPKRKSLFSSQSLTTQNNKKLADDLKELRESANANKGSPQIPLKDSLKISLTNLDNKPISSGSPTSIHLDGSISARDLTSSSNNVDRKKKPNPLSRSHSGVKQDETSRSPSSKKRISSSTKLSKDDIITENGKSKAKVDPSSAFAKDKLIKTAGSPQSGSNRPKKTKKKGSKVADDSDLLSKSVDITEPTKQAIKSEGISAITNIIKLEATKDKEEEKQATKSPKIAVKSKSKKKMVSKTLDEQLEGDKTALPEEDNLKTSIEDSEKTQSKQTEQQPVVEGDNSELKTTEQSSEKETSIPKPIELKIKKEEVSEKSGEEKSEKRRRERRRSRKASENKLKESAIMSTTATESNLSNEGTIVETELVIEKKEEEKKDAGEEKKEFTNVKELHAHYQAEKDRVQKQSVKEIERLREEIEKLKEDIKKEELNLISQIQTLENEEKAAAKNLQLKLSKNQLVVQGGIKQVQRCKEKSKLLEDLHKKLIVCSFIPDSFIFMNIFDMYKREEVQKLHLTPGDIFVDGHLGYEVDKHLKEYSKKMKVVYCAVNSCVTNNQPGTSGLTLESVTAALQKQMLFSASAVKYLLQPKDASKQYGKLRREKITDERFVRNVWDLLEDPMTAFFATKFGFAPSIKKMRTNCTVRIPVDPADLFFDCTEQQKIKYAKKEKFLQTSPVIQEEPVEQNGDLDLQIPVSDPEKSRYLIRCRYISPFATDVDPSLVVKVNDRSTLVLREDEEISEGSIYSSTNALPPTLEPSKRAHRGSVYNVQMSALKKSGNTPINVPDSPRGASGPSNPAFGQSTFHNILIVHIHGGGWISQSPDQHLPYVSEWAKRTNSPVLSIDYSLSPETQYPIAVNECFAIYKWLQIPENQNKLGIYTTSTFFSHFYFFFIFFYLLAIFIFFSII